MKKYIIALLFAAFVATIPTQAQTTNSDTAQLWVTAIRDAYNSHNVSFEAGAPTLRPYIDGLLASASTAGISLPVSTCFFPASGFPGLYLSPQAYFLLQINNSSQTGRDIQNIIQSPFVNIACILTDTAAISATTSGIIEFSKPGDFNVCVADALQDAQNRIAGSSLLAYYYPTVVGKGCYSQGYAIWFKGTYLPTLANNTVRIAAYANEITSLLALPQSPGRDAALTEFRADRLILVEIQ